MKKLLSLTVIITLLTLPALAQASSPSSTCLSYSPQTCQLQQITKSRHHVNYVREAGVRSNSSKNTNSSLHGGISASASPGGSLPFTGLDLLALTAGGLLLVGSGLLLRRFSIANKK
jgi:hypothetical protein